MANPARLAPPPDDHRLGEVEELPEASAEPGPAEAQREGKGGEVGGGRASEGGEMCARQISPAGRQDRVGAGVLPPLGVVEQWSSATRWTEIVSISTPRARSPSTSRKNEGVRDGRVVADEVGDLHGHRRRSRAWRFASLRPARQSGRRGSYRQGKLLDTTDDLQHLAFNPMSSSSPRNSAVIPALASAKRLDPGPKSARQRPGDRHRIGDLAADAVLSVIAGRETLPSRGAWDVTAAKRSRISVTASLGQGLLFRGGARVRARSVCAGRRRRSCYFLDKTPALRAFPSRN